MRSALLSSVAFVACLFSLVSVLPGPGGAHPVAPSAVESAPSSKDEPMPSSWYADPLAAYVHGAMVTWAKERHDDAFWRDIAADIAAVSPSRREAVLLASLAFHEGRYREYVDQHKCNDRAWRKTKEGLDTMLSGGDCDGGYAYSLWQIHPREAHTTGAALRDRREAARAALSLTRRGPCGYTGEPGPCPKGETRWALAESYLADHPAP